MLLAFVIFANKGQINVQTPKKILISNANSTYKSSLPACRKFVSITN